MKWESTGIPTEELWCGKLEPVAASPPYGRELMQSLGLPGLQVGSFERRHPSCLNADLCGLVDFALVSTEPQRIFRVEGGTHFIQLDATKPLPFGEGAFDWVYAEHFIEHITLAEAIGWLKEVRRVLRPGGFARITTPDLRRYVRGYLAADDAFFAAHRDRMLQFGFPPMETRKAWMINQIFQFWGHRWIYDLDELRWAVGQAGFDPAALTECGFRQGRDPQVSALDHELRDDETLYVEVPA
jgi:SAM-dependent methyltransferase